MTETEKRCLVCGHPLEIVWVHGHGQCKVCHTNIAPCCDGETNGETPEDRDER